MWRKTVKMLLTTDPPYLRGLESDGLFLDCIDLLLKKNSV